jgi:hypothetical protein
MRECEPARSITIAANSSMENSVGLPIFTGPVTSGGVAIKPTSPSTMSST